MSEFSEFFVPSSDNIKLHARLRTPSNPRRMPSGEVGVFLICHGLLDTKHATLFQGLQRMLPYVSIAFDFRGSGHSTGTTNYGNYLEEAEDIRHMVDHINGQDEQRVIGIIGHSKGGSSMFLFAQKYPAMCPQLLINLSARYWLDQEIAGRWKPHHLEALEKEGVFMWRKFGGTPAAKAPMVDDGYAGLASVDDVPMREYWVTADHLRMRNATDMSVVQRLPFQHCYVLNIMGSKDKVVPERDVWEYDRVMRLGAPDSHRVVTQVVEGASHFWSKQFELAAIEDIISSWLSKVLPLAKL
ncbi:alpha/beta-hydrolase [Linderina pennispora]|uniref:Alpha/beta-hydrolase n=1 Tax=Linderina pennispora TaxID=61395 RepID=A0A1Y1VYV7_9FUNG|nr:alpha/beta-hydrolase [Linderina pennispora]ORX66432.1 alpha/beta-hydrolase [Linderina pennispora]